MQLVLPGHEYLPGYIHALEQGWSIDNLRPEAGREELAQILADADSFLARQVDPTGAGKPITLPDGSVVPRLPGYRKWMWDGEFCGAIGFRWQRGTSDLPWYCLGHIGFSVVPWKRRRGYATKSLRLLLAEIPREDFEYVELTTDVTNVASQRVIEANGGTRVETFFKHEAYGGAESFRYRIYFNAPAR
ncbi:MAG: GNAT family N-acetyltransferase [Gemmatimonadaceae bacterium]